MPGEMLLLFEQDVRLLSHPAEGEKEKSLLRGSVKGRIVEVSPMFSPAWLTEKKVRYQL